MSLHSLLAPKYNKKLIYRIFKCQPGAQHASGKLLLEILDSAVKFLMEFAFVSFFRPQRVANYGKLSLIETD